MTASPTPSERMLVADSFRVRVGAHGAEVRGYDRHLARFMRTVREACGSALPDTRDFLREAAVRIDEYGEGHPRWELWETESGGFEHRLSLRPLPALGETIVLATAGPVSFEHPERKGPNIPLFSALNREHGAEVILTGDDGEVREGTTTALIWWVDGTLCTSASTKRVPSVTEQLVREIAGEAGIHHLAATVTTQALHGREVWAVNALHGIRPATLVDGIAAPKPNHPRLERFAASLDETWARVIEGEATRSLLP